MCPPSGIANAGLRPVAHGRLSLDLVEPDGPVHESARDHRSGALVSSRRMSSRAGTNAGNGRRSAPVEGLTGRCPVSIQPPTLR